MSDQTTMAAAFERANLLPAQNKLEKYAREAKDFGAFFRKLDGNPEVALCLFTIDEIEARARRKFGQYHPAAGPARVDAHTGCTSGEVADRGGHRFGNEHTAVTPARPPQTQRSGNGAGQGLLPDDQNSNTRHAPGHSKRSGPAYFEERAKSMATVLETFAIIDRNGERLPVGQIYVQSYDRLIKMTARRSWRASREHTLLTLLKEAADRKGVIPNDARTADIFDVKEVEALLETATKIATPKLPDESEDRHAA